MCIEKLFLSTIKKKNEKFPLPPQSLTRRVCSIYISLSFLTTLTTLVPHAYKYDL